VEALQLIYGAPSLICAGRQDGEAYKTERINFTAQQGARFLEKPP
jgi:hypothetical protein